MPDHPEEMAFSDLGTFQQQGFNGQLGKKSTSLIERMISSIMPSGFTYSATRKYLDDRWGLGPGHQSGVLLLALSMQPSARFPSREVAQEFLDGIVKEYSLEAGIALSKETPTLTASMSVTVGDLALVNNFVQDQKVLSEEICELLSRNGDGSSSSDTNVLHELQQNVMDLQSELDLWTQEHGDVYASGIRPIFSSLKVRDFDSYWNWAVQDICALLEEVAYNRLHIAVDDIDKQLAYILNRSTPRVFDCATYIANKYVEEKGSKSVHFLHTARLIIDLCRESITKPPAFRDFTIAAAPQTVVDCQGNVSYSEVHRHSANLKSDQEPMFDSRSGPHLQLRRRLGSNWGHCEEWTLLYLKSLACMRTQGISFHKKHVLLTGASRGSIGEGILKGLLSGGAQVVVTTSRFSTETTACYQEIFARYGARDSRLLVVPFNQGSKGDTDSLIRFIFSDGPSGLAWDLDFVIPFAAISENGREIDQIDSKSELAHRIMLTNTLRLLGAIKSQKESKGFVNRPTQVIVPLSPNHGIFGGDGLYSETKISLETLFNRWRSESWSSYLSIMGAVIGWTRGTGLMSANDASSAIIERDAGVLTFSTDEMAANILGLMTPSLVSFCQNEPIYADLSGGLQEVTDLHEILVRGQKELDEESKIRKALWTEREVENAISGRVLELQKLLIEPRLSMKFEFPKLPSWDADIEPLSDLRGMVDLDRVVVVTGFAEIGPYGNSRTRWDIEAHGDFSPEGYLEMAWIMGLIRYVEADKINKKASGGWVDSKTGASVRGIEVKSTYGEYIRQHCGIRPIEPELSNGYDPKKKKILHEVVLLRDLEPIEVSESVAEDFKREHQDKVEVSKSKPESGQRIIRFKKGAVLMIPKAIEFDRAVVGQIPTGWDARKYGIPEDIVSQVDRATLYTLVSTAEALISAGITDPYEFYKYIHVSEIGNCLGSGLGGVSSLSKIHRDRFLDKSIQQDTLQETFINTTAAWVNMLLFSSCGPIRTPVGACATSLESLDTGYEIIMSGKAKMCLVGGFDDFSEEVSYEFGMMGATLNTDQDGQRGRAPSEMSRPTASSRAGFVESHGCGVQIITTAQLALTMGLPIYGIIALTGTASDKASRSVPAPGRGITAYARETPGNIPSPLLDISYRRRRLERRLNEIQELEDDSICYFQQAAVASTEGDPRIKACIAQIHSESQAERKEARFTLGGNVFYQYDVRISPIRGALAVWNLTVDDLAFNSFHGTSTKLNDTNESAVLQAQLSHLCRSRGNPLFGVFQKYLTGHPKGAAGAWMLNGSLQAMTESLIPGNRNADNIDAALRQYDHIVYPNRSIRKDVKAFSVTSFGFGQKGAQVIGVNPKFLFAVLDQKGFNDYTKRRASREKLTRRRFHESIIRNDVFRIKEGAPYGDGIEELGVLLDSSRRIDVGA
jgi:fatty acid synthase subunit alpha, fungi type